MQAKVKLYQDLKELITLLTSHKVEFLIVGAQALAWSCDYKTDIYFFIHPSPENAEEIVSVLEELRVSSLGLSALDFQEPNQVIQLGREPHRIGLLTHH